MKSVCVCVCVCVCEWRRGGEENVHLDFSQIEGRLYVTWCPYTSLFFNALSLVKFGRLEIYYVLITVYS